jgi:hypothetical protein
VGRLIGIGDRGGFIGRGVLIGFIAVALIGCGPTAEALTTPTPVPFPTTPGTATPTQTPGPVGTPGATPTDEPVATEPTSPTASPGEPTPIPLSTPTPSSTPATPPGWQQLTDFPASEAFEVTSVTAASAGFVAVGFKQMPDEGFFGRRQGIVWRSPDGRAWEAAVDPIFQFVTLEEVATLGDSVFVFGSLETCDLNSAEECIEPVDAGWGIWRSRDGGAWERLPTPESMLAGTMDGVTTGNGQIVAFGWTGDESQSAIVWQSADGITWTETTDVVGMDPITAMAAFPGGLAAFGTRFSEEIGDLELLAGVAVDGSHFEPGSAPALPATTMQSVAAGPAGLVAVGDGDDLDIGFNGVVLHSSDGRAWAEGQAVDGTFAGRTLRFVHAMPQGYLALGLMHQESDGSATGASWVSTDGLSWQTVAPFGGSFSLLDASAAGPSGVIAFTVTSVGFEDEAGTSTIAAWFAPLETFPAP